MEIDLEIPDLDPEAARQYIDARAAYTELERTRRNALQVRGGMVWKTVKGKDYLIRTTPEGGQSSLGAKSEQTLAVFEKFTERKSTLTARLARLKESMAMHERLNRALRVGRMPNIAVAILNRISSAGLDEHFRIVGTHALYAYEAAAGVRLGGDVTATRDIDLLWDTRKRVVFAQRLALDAPSMLEVLRKADKTFELREDQKYTAVNASGFEVDILRREAEENDPHPIRLSESEDDFWVVQARRAADLQNAAAFSEVVVAINGTMARMHTIDPRAFADFKRWMSRQADREAVKRRRDMLQAQTVDLLIRERLPQMQPWVQGQNSVPSRQ
ncbi:MAG: hypothetical protein JOY84_19565 [Curvibacter sp.]|nr:hypothetical protein [Curvibacter sp.]